MDFSALAKMRQSCRKYDGSRPIEQEKIDAILSSARLAPSACNGQPYKMTLCKGEAARKAAKATQGMGMNAFTNDAPLMLVISEEPYCRSAAVGAKLKKNDYRSIDIGILAAYITAEAADQGLGSCILGWLDDEKLRKICGVRGAVRLVISLGYPKEGDPIREKKRKKMEELLNIVEEIK